MALHCIRYARDMGGVLMSPAKIYRRKSGRMTIDITHRRFWHRLAAHLLSPSERSRQ